MNLAFAAVIAVCVGLDCPPQAPFYDPMTNDRLTLRKGGTGRAGAGIRDWPAQPERDWQQGVETRHSRMLAPRERILGALVWRWRRRAGGGPETMFLLVAASGRARAEFVSVGFYEGAGREIVAGPLPRVVMPALRGIEALPPDADAQFLRFGDLWSETGPDNE